MIQKIMLIIGFLLIVSCGGSDDEGVAMINTPILQEPTNQFICLDHENINFQWNQVESATAYQIEISNTSNFNNIAKRITGISNNSTTLSLEPGITYYWRVKAFSGDVESENSNVFQFYTQGEAVTNQLPQTPTLIAPESNQIVSDTQVNLSWFSTDTDASNTLVFDVYFGTSSTDLTLVSQNQEALVYIAKNLAIDQIYYWRIAAKDNVGGIAISSIWTFTVSN